MHVGTVRHWQLSQPAMPRTVHLLHCMDAQTSVCFRILVYIISFKKRYTISNKCKTSVVLAVRIKYLGTP